MKPGARLEDVLFGHEHDLLENLRRFPLAARYRLDCIGLSLDLADWQALTFEQRALLCVRAVETDAERARLKAEVVDMRHAHGRDPKPEAPERLADFADAMRVPESIRKALALRAIDLTPARWMALPLLARFALAKFTREGHENRRLPALLNDLFASGASDTAPESPISAQQSSADH